MWKTFSRFLKTQNLTCFVLIRGSSSFFFSKPCSEVGIACQPKLSSLQESLRAHLEPAGVTPRKQIARLQRKHLRLNKSLFFLQQLGGPQFVAALQQSRGQTQPDEHQSQFPAAQLFVRKLERSLRELKVTIQQTTLALIISYRSQTQFRSCF